MVLLKTAWKSQSCKLACLLYSSKTDSRRHEHTDVQKESALEKDEWLVDLYQYHTDILMKHFRLTKQKCEADKPK